MREFTNKLKNELLGGLRPDERLRQGVGFLYDAFGVEARFTGLQGAEVVEMPLSTTLDWPFPQLIRGEGETFLLRRNAILTVDEETWLASLVDVEIPSGGIWQLADAKDAFYLFNGSCVVYKDGSSYKVETGRFPKAGIEHRGRIVCGGFAEGTTWPEWLEPLFESVGEERGEMLGRNWVVWSSIGGGDFPLWLFDSYSKDFFPEDFQRRMKENTFGWAQMPFRGEVRGFHRMGKELLVFGSDGVAGLTLAGPHYGVRTVSGIGVPGRGAFGGYDGLAFWLDNRGQLRVWQGGDQPPQNLGYQEFLGQLVSAEPLLSYDEEVGRLFIAGEEDKADAFVLSILGRERPSLTAFPQRLTSVIQVEGEAVGVGEELGDGSGLIVTPEFDGGMRSIKTLTGTEVNYRSKKQGRVWSAVDFRYEDGDDWRTSKWVRLNKEGRATLRVSGTDFRLRLRFEFFEDANIDYIDLKWQAPDRRTRRGTFVGQEQPD